MPRKTATTISYSDDDILSCFSLDYLTTYTLNVDSMHLTNWMQCKLFITWKNKWPKQLSLRECH